MTPEPDEDFVDPADEYKMPWEEDKPLLEGVSSNAGSASSYAAWIGLEISGSEEFVTDACAFVLEFRDIYSTELSPEPVDLPPLDVPIDTAKWHQPKNQGRPRNQSVEGQQEIKRHLEKLLECGATSPVLHASAYSQVLLVTKPDTKEKRLVLDALILLIDWTGIFIVIQISFLSIPSPPSVKGARPSKSACFACCKLL